MLASALQSIVVLLLDYGENLCYFNNSEECNFKDASFIFKE
jgi:hypothetical protein